MHKLVLAGGMVATFVFFAAQRSAAEQALGPLTILSDREVGEEFSYVVYNSNRDEYLALWSDYPFSPGGIHGQRLDRYGKPLGAAIQISPSTGNNRSWPVAAYDPAEDAYLVVYMYDYSGNKTDWDIHMCRLGGDGVLLSPEYAVVDTTDSEWTPEVAFSTVSNRYLVTWMVHPSGGVKGALFSWGDEIVPFVVEADAWAEEGADVAWQPYGDNFLVVYTNHLETDVMGKIVGSDGLIGTEIAIAGWPDKEWEPVVASCQNYQYLVVWTSGFLNADEDADVYGRFLLGDGSFWGDPFRFYSDAQRQFGADVACLHGGTEYLVAFTWRSRNDYSATVLGQRVRAAGQVSEFFGFGTAPTGMAYWTGHVAGGTTGWFTTYERYENPMYPLFGDIDVAGRVAWQLFADGFEWGNTANWSASDP